MLGAHPLFHHADESKREVTIILWKLSLGFFADVLLFLDPPIHTQPNRTSHHIFKNGALFAFTHWPLIGSSFKKPRHLIFGSFQGPLEPSFWGTIYHNFLSARVHP